MKLLSFSLLLIMLMFSLLSCEDDSIRVDILQAYRATENIDPTFRRQVVDGLRNYYFYGSQEEFRKWWNEVHPELFRGESDEKYIGRYWETNDYDGVNGYCEIWVVGKLTPAGLIRLDPFVWAAENLHVIEKLIPEMESPHDWYYRPGVY